MKRAEGRAGVTRGKHHHGLFPAEPMPVVDPSCEVGGSGPSSLHTLSPLTLTANNCGGLLLGQFANKETGSERSSHLAQGHIIGAEPRVPPDLLDSFLWPFEAPRASSGDTRQNSLCSQVFPTSLCSRLKKCAFAGSKELIRTYTDQGIF